MDFGIRNNIDGLITTDLMCQGCKMPRMDIEYCLCVGYTRDDQAVVKKRGLGQTEQLCCGLNLPPSQISEEFP